ncbi:MAG: HlyC/CorC family transporter [Bacteroidetes bacterium]|nr:HlyC/CorC family transporter [Bacteroidota bacterium]
MTIETGYLVILALTLVLSAFFSGSEISFVTANRLKIEIKNRQGKSGAALASWFVNKPENFLITTLVGNNFVNIAYSTVMSIFLIESFGIKSILFQTLISTTLLLFAGEIIPKSIARQFADKLVFILVYPLRFFYFFLYPFVFISRMASLFLIRIIGIKPDSFDTFFNYKDVEMILEEGKTNGSIDPGESELIENVFELKDQKVRESMIPRTDIVAIDVSDDIEDCIRIFKESGFSKIPVYEEEIDNITGIIHAHDLFRQPKSLQEIIRPVMFVTEFKKSSELMKDFRDKKTSVAIVIDEFGGTAGLVTLEDLIEELVGDIQDEYDTDENILKKLDEDVYLVSGRTLVEDINEKFLIGMDEGDFETVGGFVIHNSGRIPHTGEKLELGRFQFTVIKATKNRLDLLKLQVKQTE